MVASFHVSITTPNLYRQESVHTAFDTFSRFITPMPAVQDGSMWPSARPGLGIELNYDEIDRHIVDKDDPATMWGAWRKIYKTLPGSSPIQSH
jgi:L-alanine-DL-glutamate epimerase-like enolase superfamily enzyme